MGYCQHSEKLLVGKGSGGLDIDEGGGYIVACTVWW
jgi:hypothetical protein